MTENIKWQIFVAPIITSLFYYITFYYIAFLYTWDDVILYKLFNPIYVHLFECNIQQYFLLCIVLLNEYTIYYFCRRTKSERQFKYFASILESTFIFKMTSYRKNSLVIDFSVIPVRPKLDIVRNFVFTKIGLDLKNMRNIQTCITKPYVIIEAETAAMAEELIEQHNMKHTLEHEDKHYAIPLYTPEKVIEVKIFHLTCQTTL